MCALLVVNSGRVITSVRFFHTTFCCGDAIPLMAYAGEHTAYVEVVEHTASSEIISRLVDEWRRYLFF